MFSKLSGRTAQGRAHCEALQVPIYRVDAIVTDETALDMQCSDVVVLVRCRCS